MTTINNDQSLIEKVGGIVRAREIVEGAHWENISYSNGSYYSHSCGKNDICLEDLRTAIASHEPKMHSHLTSDALQGDDIAKHDTTDHVTDIRNHVSPSTKVVDL